MSFVCRLLHKACSKAYTREMILAAFEATGIHPFDAYQTDVMRDFRERAQEASRQARTQNYVAKSRFAHENHISRSISLRF
jgi:citrate lyase beta subunit